MAAPKVAGPLAGAGPEPTNGILVKEQTATDENTPRKGNMVGTAGGVYYEFAEGHVGQDEERLGDDNRAWDKIFNGSSGPNAKGDQGKNGVTIAGNPTALGDHETIR